MVLRESILQALFSIRSNKLRAFLTLLSIAIGIFALMGSGTLVTSLEHTVSSQILELGQNTFRIARRPSFVVGHRAWRRYWNRPPITLQEAMKFKERMQPYARAVGFAADISGVRIKYEEQTTNDDFTLYGVDGGFFFANRLDIEEGRPITDEDLLLNRPIAVVGADVVRSLFPASSPLGQHIFIRGRRLQVVGVLKARGNVMGQSLDKVVFVPATIFLRYFSQNVPARWRSFALYVEAPSAESLQETIDQAIAILRGLRNLKPWEENNFEVQTNEAIGSQFDSFMQYLQIFGLGTGIIALLAAGIGIMNIMLVAVQERTREIGLRKAVGAKVRHILTQFVLEALTLSQLGGIAGIVLGGVAAALVGSSLGFQLVLPLNWIIGSVLICTLLGVIFGSYPAWKAARLDPVEALRYE